MKQDDIYTVMAAITDIDSFDLKLGHEVQSIRPGEVIEIIEKCLAINNSGIPKTATVRTNSGKLVDVLNIQESDIDIYDIAHSLSRMPRFGGHPNDFYSVAQHSIAVCYNNQVPQEQKLAALLHDAAEYLLLDLPSPIKQLFPFYKEIENKIMAAIAKKYGFQFPFHESIKKADAIIGNEEKQSLHHHDFKTMILPMDEAKYQFIQLFNQLIEANESRNEK